MADSNVFKDTTLTDDDLVKRDIFLRFHYADSKDAFKQLFAVITAVFVFSATFGQKAGAAADVEWYWKLYYFSPYALFSLSLAICLVGYYVLGMAGDKATNLKIWGYWLPSWNDMEFSKCALRSSTALEVSGGVFLLGLLMLAVVAVF
jgi:hypothetical protein